MAALIGGPRNPLMLGLLAAGALWLYSRRAGAATPASRGKQTGGQTYATPTSMGDELARLVVGMTRGVLPAMSSGLPTAPIVPPASPGGSSINGTQGWNLQDLYGSNAPYNGGWAGPTPSLLNPFTGISRVETAVDQIPAAPIYDPTVDYQTNAWNLWGNSP